MHSDLNERGDKWRFKKPKGNHLFIFKKDMYLINLIHKKNPLPNKLSPKDEEKKLPKIRIVDTHQLALNNSSKDYLISNRKPIDRKKCLKSLSKSVRSTNISFTYKKPYLPFKNQILCEMGNLNQSYHQPRILPPTKLHSNNNQLGKAYKSFNYDSALLNQKEIISPLEKYTKILIEDSHQIMTSKGFRKVEC